MQKITKEQAKELGITQELLEQLPEGILNRLDSLKVIIEQQGTVERRRATMEEKHGEYNTCRKSLKEAMDTLQEMIHDAHAPTLFNRVEKHKDERDPIPELQESDDFGGAPESPFGKKRGRKPKRGGLEHPAVSAVTGQRAII